jgi:riboflavin kinase
VGKGYGRGSKKLGFPTANLPQFHTELAAHSVERGVYCGFAAIQNEREHYPCVVNIGISPTFQGQVRERKASDVL